MNGRQEASISTALLLRIITALIAAWSLLAGIALVFFQGSSSGALGAGVADVAGQRLLGAHLIVLAPVYAVIAWRHDQYKGLAWLPLASQLCVFLSVSYSIMAGDTEFGDAFVAVAVSAIFIGLFAFVSITEQRALARARFEAEESRIDWLDDQTALDEPV
jgi:hypothetical protein